MQRKWSPTAYAWVASVPPLVGRPQTPREHQATQNTCRSSTEMLSGVPGPSCGWMESVVSQQPRRRSSTREQLLSFVFVVNDFLNSSSAHIHHCDIVLFPCWHDVAHFIGHYYLIDNWLPVPHLLLLLGFEIIYLTNEFIDMFSSPPRPSKCRVFLPPQRFPTV